MNILFNLLLLAVILFWFRDHFLVRSKKVHLGIVGSFLLSSILIFALSLYVQHDYLDGLIYLIAGCVSIVMFWVISTAIILWKNLKDGTKGRIFPDLVQLLPLIVVPAVLWLWIGTANFKIGG